ncbi:MAG TPA: hypothetical protein VLG47_04145 [Candidatus Saccharimonadales bacterium]|nr:hypothetical protein [Candidatus Saccharimonadales bacterium]
MAHGRVDVRGIEFQVFVNPEYSGELAASVMALDERALQASQPDRSPDEIRMAIGNSETDFALGRTDPNTLVGTRFRERNLYASPIQVLARTATGRLVGEAYGANNTSGPARQDRMVARIPLHVWDWRRMIAVDPAFQSRGIATIMSALITDHRNLAQPMSAYVWKVPRVNGLLVRGGMKPNGQPEDDFAFGAENDPISRQRYVGRVAVARTRLLLIPGARVGLRYARDSVRANSEL